jgi:hypothetical protein
MIHPVNGVSSVTPACQPAASQAKPPVKQPAVQGPDTVELSATAKAALKGGSGDVDHDGDSK